MCAKKIAVLTSGGDAPGMNAAVRAVVRTAISFGMEVYGVRHGYNGLLTGEVQKMELRSVSNIIQHGGTALFTARSPEFNTPEGVQKAAAKCRELGIDGVVVVGGGPAGLEAARVSALRGHDVTLLEASDALGGALKPAGVPHFKQADRDLVAWYAATLAHLGVDVRLNTRADKALLDSLKPQTVFVAEGSTPRTLALPGADGDNVVSALDVLEGKAKAGKSVVIIGAGLVACELALHLVQNGHTVTLLARRKLLRSAKLPAMNELMLRDLLVFHGVHIVEGAALESVDAKGVYYEVEGVPALAEGDTVITAVGMEANHALFDAIRDDYETVLALGDGRRVRNIFGAIWDGYEAARSL